MRTKLLKISDFAEVYSGGTPSTSNPGYWDGDIPWVTPKDMAGQNSVYIDHGERSITEEALRHSSAYLLPQDTVVLSSRAPVGYVAIAKTALTTNQGCKNLVCRAGIAVPLFVYYLLKNNTVTLESHATGATYKELSKSRLQNIKFRFPEDTKIQSHIASVLLAYDDLIENNRRRIQLLEQAARLLYKEWFVHLRFPGHEHTKIKDGVPEGWEKKKIFDVCETVGGGTPSTKVGEYWDGDITWVVPTDVTRNNCLALLDSERKITSKGLRESSAKIVPPGTILMTSRASVGFFALMDKEVCTNQGFINIIPRSDSMHMHLLFNLMNRVDEICSNAKGTTYPEISKGRFREMPIIVPSPLLSEEFGRIAGRIVDQVRCLKKQEVHLSKARDLLLPRLMNGEVAV